MKKNYILDRLSERSTWIGLTALLGAFSVFLSPEQAEAIVVAGVSFAGLISTLTRDSAEK